MKTLTAAERARRAAVLGITLPAPTVPSRRQQQAQTTAPGRARKLAATPAMQRVVASRPPPVPAPPPPPPAEPPAPAPASAVAAEPARKRRRWPPITADEYAVFRHIRLMMQERYPQIFSWGRPLAIGIDQKLREAFTEEELSTADLSVFLRIWVRRHAYRAALQRGDRRVNLDGSDAGPAFGDGPEAPPGPAPSVSAGG